MFGQRKWNWPRGSSPSSVVLVGAAASRIGAALGRERARRSRARTRRRRRRATSTRLRVRDRAVVALEEVLADDLPVRLDLGLRAEAVHEPVDVEPELGDLRRHRAERLLERLARRASVFAKTNGPQVPTATRQQAELLAREVAARRPSAAPRGASRRGRRSRRGTGTGASRACPRPRRPGSRGAGRRSGRRAARRRARA